MNATAAIKLARAASTSRGTAERHELPETVIGKDVLELVSSAMYVDPMTVYREYIQNAADAVDAARAAGQLAASELGRVEISVEPGSRTVQIRDNGCGVPFQEFGRKLTALGGSAKRGTPARGFRGVGRLAGLAYAQELIFRSRVPGEAKISELRWDCRRLKEALRALDQDKGIAELIRQVTTLERIDISEAPQRFFEVEMRGIVRLRNDRLMSPTAIGEYLSQVAPVPFSPDFQFGGQITEALSHHLDLGVLDIRIDGAEEPLYRPHRDRFVLDNKADITFDDVTLIEIAGIDGDAAAVGWVLHHQYEGAVPTGTLVKGLRLRAGNVQVGDNTLLEDLFPEPRFNVWSVGEVHVLDRKVVPNGRRDHFEQNAHYSNLLNHLTPTARDIARRCRTSSVRRKWVREFEIHEKSASETLDIVAQGGVGRGERDRKALLAEQSLLKMEKVAGMDLLAENREALGTKISQLRTRLCTLMRDAEPVASPLKRLPEEKRKTFEQFFELIYECSANRIAAKSLIDRILLKLE
ncbi:ATP-binding protein [Mesorhizobium sp. PL10]